MGILDVGAFMYVKGGVREVKKKGCYWGLVVMYIV